MIVWRFVAHVILPLQVINVISIILQIPSANRFVLFARSVGLKEKNMRCVDMIVGRVFAVHVEWFVPVFTSVLLERKRIIKDMKMLVISPTILKLF